MAAQKYQFCTFCEHSHYCNAIFRTLFPAAGQPPPAQVGGVQPLAPPPAAGALAVLPPAGQPPPAQVDGAHAGLQPPLLQLGLGQEPVQELRELFLTAYELLVNSYPAMLDARL